METPGATPWTSRHAEGLPVWPSGWTVSVVEETGSTNSDLLAAAADGAPHRSVLAALHQTSGRGRLDRRWDAPPGVNLLASILVRDVPDNPHVLTQRVGLAAVAACRKVAGATPVLKWPNDLLLDGVKLAGILAQAQLGAAPAVVVGIGLNVGWAPPGAARLGDDIRPMRLLAELLQAYDDLPDDVWLQYRDHLATIGRHVRVELPDGLVEGRALDVEQDGRLIVVDECGVTHRFAVGDVVHLR